MDTVITIHWGDLTPECQARMEPHLHEDLVAEDPLFTLHIATAGPNLIDDMKEEVNE